MVLIECPVKCFNGSGCSETAAFLLDAGARVQPWSWLQEENLSPSLFSSAPSASLAHARLRRAAAGPPPLRALARAACRSRLQRLSGGKSVFPLVARLPAAVGEEERRLLRLADLRAVASGGKKRGGG